MAQATNSEQYKAAWLAQFSELQNQVLFDVIGCEPDKFADVQNTLLEARAAVELAIDEASTELFPEEFK